MPDRTTGPGALATPALAEILLDQGLLTEARRLLARLDRERPGDGRIPRLLQRLGELEGAGDPVQEPLEGCGRDRVILSAAGRDLTLCWELTGPGLDLARRTARYSGTTVVRLLTVTSGPRGTRKTTRDIALQHPCGRVLLPGLPCPAVHVAAVGFLARSGAFVPLATSAPVERRDP